MEMFGQFMTLLFAKLKQIRKQQDAVQQEKELQATKREGPNSCPHCSCPACRRNRTFKKQPSPGPKLAQVPRMPPLPTTFSLIRSTIKKGKFAFLPNLPHARVRKDKNHAYVLPSDCIKHFLATGNEPMLFDQRSCEFPHSEARDTPRGVEIADHLRSSAVPGESGSIPHLALSFLEWKDDCESARSNKASKTGTWVFTITIFLKDKKMDSPRATFAVAIGPKSESHDPVEAIIGNDLKSMKATRTVAFLGGRNHTEPVAISFSAEMYCSLGDQPERRGCNYLMAGNSTGLASGEMKAATRALTGCLI
jgi:hypothetical protein